ncbi:MAG TPA: sugar phosphate isomerase/epimerase [Steroidobacteraceae bacterium]
MLTLSRRNFLIAGGSGLVLGAVGCSTTQPFFRRTGLPLGLQLYTVSADLNKDFDGTLSTISKTGYKTVEMAGLLDRSPAVWREALERAHLRCPSSHVPARASRGASLNDDLGTLAQAAHTIGIGTIVCPSIYVPDRFSLAPLPGEDFGQMLTRIRTAMTVDDWKWNADYLNGKGAGLKQYGLRFAYHNHNFEFAPVGDSTGMAILLKNTDPALVSFEMDAGWVAAAGVDPVGFLAKYPGRFTAMHVKDIKASTQPNFELRQDPTEVGQGTIDWRVLLAKAYAANVRQFYVEQEPPFSHPPLESVALSFNYLNALVA